MSRHVRPAVNGTELARFSLNQITIDQWSLEEAVAACVAAEIPMIGIWRHKLEGEAAARIVRDSGLRVSSLCRGGFFPASSDRELRERESDNRRAVEEAAELGTDVLVLVCGSPVGRDLAGARSMIAAGIERLLPHAIECGVKLGIEPLHPVFVAERSAICSLREANDLAALFDTPHVGVVVDVYHVFWEAGVEVEIARAAGRILGFHISDWTTPTGDILWSRAMMGDGIIDVAGLWRAAVAAGYDGPVEVEVISATLRTQPPDDVLRLVLTRYLDVSQNVLV